MLPKHRSLSSPAVHSTAGPSICYTFHMISISGKAPRGISQRAFLSRLKKTLREAITILRWEDLPLTVSIKVFVDPKLPIGGGRAAHGKIMKTLRVHPHPDRPFPWNTIRHELLHILLKKQIQIAFSPTTKPLLIGAGYKSQTTRENVEEYVVRSLNNLFLKKTQGIAWYRAQLRHEEKSGFYNMEVVSRIVEKWNSSRTPFTASVLEKAKTKLLQE